MMRAWVIFTLMIFSVRAVAQTESVECSYQNYLGFAANHEGFYDLVFHNSHIYMMTYEGLEVFDVSVSAVPEPVGNLDLMEHMFSGVIEGDHLYATSDSGFLIINIANPAGPYLVGSMSLQQGRSVVVRGEYAYVASEKRLFVVDISSRFFPMLAHINHLDGNIADLIVDEQTLYVFYDNDGLAIFDLEFPTVPKLLGAVEFDYVFGRPELVGDKLYIASDSPGVVVVDVSDPTNPFQCDSMHEGFYLGDLRVQGGRVYGVESNYLHIFSLEDEHEIVSSFALREGGQRIVINGSRAYVGGSNGIEVLDIGNEVGSPLVFRGKDLLQNPGNIVVDSGFAYVSDTRDGFRVFDVTDPSNTALIYSNEGLNQGALVELIDHYLLVTQQFSNPLIFDVSDPYMPVDLGTMDLTPDENVLQIFCIEAGFLVTGETDGYKLYAVDDPLEPILLSLFSPSGPIRDVEIEGDFMYVACFVDGIDVFDISDPVNPIWLVNHPVSSAVSSIEVRDQIVFGVDPQQQPRSYIRAYDFEDLSSIEEIGVFESRRSRRLESLWLQGDRLYTSYRFGEFIVLDASDPTMIYEIGVYSTADTFAVEDNRAYTASASEFKILDISVGCECDADLNGDGDLNFLDISAFLAAYSNENIVADFNHDGLFNFLDVSAFLSVFGAGCP